MSALPASIEVRLAQESPRRARVVAAEVMHELFAPRTTMKISEWAEKYRILPDTAAESGPWHNDRTPYLVGIMDACLEPGVERVVFRKPSQVGGSEAENNIIGYFIHQDPSPIMLVLPDLEFAKSYSKERIATMIDATPVLKNRVAAARGRDSDNTTLSKEFVGGHLAIAGANSPAGLRSRPRRVLIMDEASGYPPSAGTEGDPVDLAEARLTTFWNSLIFAPSTPTLEGLCRIQAMMDDCDEVRGYLVPCPHCLHRQELQWKQVKWDSDDNGDHLPFTAQYLCIACGALIPERMKQWMLLNGEWVAGDFNDKGVWEERKHPRPRSIGFRLSGLYSPSQWMSWGQAADKFLKAKDNRLRLQVWVNTVLGEPFKETGDQIGTDPLLARREKYDAEPLPEGVLVLTAGVDVQADRLELELLGTGFGGETWSINYLVIPGDPSVDGGPVWKRLDEILRSQWRHPSGFGFRIQACAIDSGYLTQTVYKYAKDRFTWNVWAIDGRAGDSLPIWGRPTNRNKFKTNLYPVGVDSAKTLLYSHLKIERPHDWKHGQPVPGYQHFPLRDHYDKEHFDQLTSERVVVRPSGPRGHLKRVWIRRPNRRAERLDCRVYAMSAYEGLILSGLRLDVIHEHIRSGGLREEPAERRVLHPGVTPE